MKGNGSRPGFCLWDSCSGETLRELKQMGKTAAFPGKHMVICPGRETENIFFVMEGIIQVYHLSHNGRKRIHFLLPGGHIINDNVSGGRSSVYAETLTESTLFVVKSEPFLRLLGSDGILARAVLSEQEWKLKSLERMARNSVGAVTTEKKLAVRLWRLARDFGVETAQGILIDLDLSMTLLSELLGVPRENVSRAAGKLQGRGLIDVDKKKFRIPDPERLLDFFHGREPA